MDITTDNCVSPFHRGEREIQSRLGVRQQVENVGQRFVRDYMPDEHREFYAQLPHVLLGSIDEVGRPWASVLVGRPGFVASPDAQTLTIKSRPFFGDPLKKNLSRGGKLGMLGIDYTTRRRNRLNGEISSLDDGLIRIRVDQSFGNCPQYIQSRNFELLPTIDRLGDPLQIRPISRLDARAREIISNADNFYIATHLSDGENDVASGADVSHRGGKPGFVRIEDDATLTFPDFSGNYHFNTLGNILLNPRAGLLFVDFQNGDLLHLTCDAEIVWDSEEQRTFTGAERLLKLTLDEGVLLEKAMPIRWDFVEYSPSLEQTGSWDAVAAKIDERNRGNVYRNYTVTKLESESEMITSFYLEPEDGSRVPCYEAGQYLPIEIQLPGIEAPIRRTYTISVAPNGTYYRLSIKKEAPARPELAAGVVSNFFHDHVTVGSVVRAMSPRGDFILDESSTRPVVLLSGGVGVTPLISMLDQLTKKSGGCGCTKKIWFIHGAINSRTHAFNRQIRRLEKEFPCLNVHIRYSNPSNNDSKGKDFDNEGYVDIELIKSLLPFDDYEFYMCGPTPFMESLYEGLTGLNVAGERIHYEFFGASTSLFRTQSGKSVAIAKDLKGRAPVSVRFAKSDTVATWDPSKGTLLDLAESGGLRPAYSCRSGICQTCSTKVLAGEVDYLESPTATPAAGEALLCCSYPNLSAEGDEVVLDI